MESFVFSQELAKRGKPYTEGEYIKNCFINASEELFQDFKNKADILKKIKELPLSAKTIKDRTIKMCSNISTQQIEDRKLVSALSIAVDQSCDINGTAQVSLFLRFMSHSGPKEELLELLPLKGQTRGEDIANAVIECMDKHHIPLDKIVSISTNGAKIMTGPICSLFISLLDAAPPRVCLINPLTLVLKAIKLTKFRGGLFTSERDSSTVDEECQANSINRPPRDEAYFCRS
ncbi:SCAN domain-containing protein 3 [Trichonephila clavipes]|nr:SCAN domain-containing protein 3 [Trichonephila clavipes]